MSYPVQMFGFDFDFNKHNEDPCFYLFQKTESVLVLIINFS